MIAYKEDVHWRKAYSDKFRWYFVRLLPCQQAWERLIFRENTHTCVQIKYSHLYVIRNLFIKANSQKYKKMFFFFGKNFFFFYKFVFFFFEMKHCCRELFRPLLCVSLAREFSWQLHLKQKILVSMQISYRFHSIILLHDILKFFFSPFAKKRKKYDFLLFCYSILLLSRKFMIV